MKKTMRKLVTVQLLKICAELTFCGIVSPSRPLLIYSDEWFILNINSTSHCSSQPPFTDEETDIPTGYSDGLVSHVKVMGAELELVSDSKVHAVSHPDLLHWWKVIAVKVPRTVSCVVWVFKVTN